MTFANTNITRTIFECKASAYRFDGMNSDGTPNMVEVESGSFYTLNDHDKVTARRAIKAVYPDVILDTLKIKVVGEEKRRMTLGYFYNESEVC